MASTISDRFSAGEQGLGYLYQGRFALLQILKLDESNSVFIEKDDDVDLVDANGRKTLGSLKHRAVGNRLTDLSTDFWKSVRIWLARYRRDGGVQSNLRFFLFTTSTVGSTSFLQSFTPGASATALSRTAQTAAALARATTELIKDVGAELRGLSDAEQDDFFSRISIFEEGPRIDELPALIMEHHMRSVRREFRLHVFERLEGWWNDQVINLLAGKRKEPLAGSEVSDKLSAFADEYKADNLPITFQRAVPEQAPDAETDPRLFVMQLREIGISTTRIRMAILDYYRAFEQRSAWARQQLLNADEMELYEDRLIGEWSRYKEILFEDLGPESAETKLLAAGKELYKWAEMESDHLKIRERVTEPYVIRGGFHILANERPAPRVHWHPRFLERVGALLGSAE